MHEAGINVIAVGVGKSNRTQLQQMASSPEYVVTVTQFPELTQLPTYIEELTCGACIATNWSSSINLTIKGDKSPAMFQ